MSPPCSTGRKEATKEQMKKLHVRAMCVKRGDDTNQQQRRGKAVVFDAVHVRRHEREALVNDDGGPALGLGWKFFDYPLAIPINIYERSKPPPKANFGVSSRLSANETLRVLAKYYGGRGGSDIKKTKRKEDLVFEFEGLDVLREQQIGDRPTMSLGCLPSGDDGDSLSLDSLSLDALEGRCTCNNFKKDTEPKEDASTFNDTKSTLFSSASSLFESLGEEHHHQVPKELDIIPDLIPTQEKLHLRPRKKNAKRQVAAKGA